MEGTFSFMHPRTFAFSEVVKRDEPILDQIGQSHFMFQLGISQTSLCTPSFYLRGLSIWL